MMKLIGGTMLKTTSILSSIMGLMFFWLSIRVIQQRRKHKVSIGDGGINDLAMAMRAHGNFSEYVPLSLILLGVAEINLAHELIVLAFAVAIFLGRAFHAYAFLGGKEHFKPRAIGMKLTLYTLVALSVFNLGLIAWKL